MESSAKTCRFEPRRALGQTGFKATAVGIGDLADRTIPLEECVATIHRAMDRGLNLIDTAPMYEDGYSEQIVGAALKGRRDGMFVIDKIDHFDRPVGKQIDASLRRLKLDGVDLFVFHALPDVAGWDALLAPGGPMEQLDQCMKAGKTRFRGISSHDPDTLRTALLSGLCDVLLFPVGPFVDPRFVEEILPLARQMGVGTVCFKTFGAGKLVSDTMGYGKPLKEHVKARLAAAGEAPEGGLLLPHLSVSECVHYTLACDPDVTLLGMSLPAEVDAALEAAGDFAPLNAGRMADIRRRAAEAVQDKGKCHWNPA